MKIIHDIIIAIKCIFIYRTKYFVNKIDLNPIAIK